MATTARPGDHVEITAVQSYEATWDDALDRLIGLTGVLIAVNDSHLRENERTGTLDCAPFEVRIDRDAGIEAGQIVFASGVRPVGASAHQLPAPVGPELSAVEFRQKVFGPEPAAEADPIAAARRLDLLALMDEHAASQVSPVLAALLDRAEALQAQVAALLEERHRTNEWADDAAEALRRDRDRIAELEAERTVRQNEVSAAVGYTPGLKWPDLVRLVASNTASLVQAEQDVRALRSRGGELEDKKQLADRERVELQTALERALAPFCEDPKTAAAAAAEAKDYHAEWLQRDAQRLLDRVNELEATQTPAAADSPTPLRWGLDDIEHGDDDTTTVLLSGPDGRPYWLELDPEGADALRDALTDPDKAQQP